jgi:glycosyltransferase involved in cell wall biosynthesis
MTRLAFVKYGGLSAGGTERILQTVATELVTLGLEVDYYFCEARQAPNSAWIHPPNDLGRRKFLADNGVRLIEFYVSHKDLSQPDHPWISSDFFEKFNESKYSMVWTAKAGPREFPFHLLGIPFVEIVTLDAGCDTSGNRKHTILISNGQRRRWLNQGGAEVSSSILPIPVADRVRCSDLRSELGISRDETVIGFHQRIDDSIVSAVPFEAASKVKNLKFHFILMGGGEKYRQIAKEYGVNTTFLEHHSDWKNISRFLKTLDVYAHGRHDGETFGTVLAEAMMYGVPIVSHSVKLGANDHVETIANGGFFAYSTKEYSLVLDALMNDKALRAQVGERGQVFAESTYSREAFRNGLIQIVTKLGLKTSMRKNTRTNIEIEMPKSLPGSRILVHQLPKGFTKQLELMCSEAMAISKLLTRFLTEMPLTIHARGLMGLMVGIESGRYLTRINYVAQNIDQDLVQFVAKLFEINGIDNFAFSTLDFLKPKSSLLTLNFSDSQALIQNKKYSDRILLDTLSKNFSFVLFVPVVTKDNFRITKVRIRVQQYKRKKGLFLFSKSLLNMAYLVSVILDYLYTLLKSKRNYRRFIHVKYLLFVSFKRLVRKLRH